MKVEIGRRNYVGPFRSAADAGLKYLGERLQSL